MLAQEAGKNLQASQANAAPAGAINNFFLGEAGASGGIILFPPLGIQHVV